MENYKFGDEETRSASLGARAIAYLVDSALVVAIWFLTFLFAAVAAAIWPGAYDFFLNVAAVIFVCLPLFWFAYQWLFNSLGWSPGKRFRSLAIERDTGAYLMPRPGPPRGGTGLVRTLGQAIGVIPFGLGYWWAAWDSQNQAWHDKMAATHVVRVASPKPSLESLTVAGTEERTHRITAQDERFPIDPPSRETILKSIGLSLLPVAFFLILSLVLSGRVLPWEIFASFGVAVLVLALSGVRRFRFLRGYVRLTKKGIKYSDGQGRKLIRWADVNGVAREPDGSVLVTFTQRHWFRSPTEETASFNVESPDEFVADVKMRTEMVKASEATAVR